MAGVLLLTAVCLLFAGMDMPGTDGTVLVTIATLMLLALIPVFAVRVRRQRRRR